MKAVDLNPGDADMHFKMAELFHYEGEFYLVCAAVVHYKKAVELDPFNPDWRIKLAEALQCAIRIDDGDDYWRKFPRRHDPNYQDYHGLNLYETICYDEARSIWIDDPITHLIKAVELDPRNPDRQVKLKEELIRAERHDEATKRFRAAVEVDVGNPDWHIKLAEALGRVLQRDVAIEFRTAAVRAVIECFRTAVELDPVNPNWHSKLAGALEGSNRDDAAIVHWMKAVDLDPGKVNWHIKLVQALDNFGRHDLAMERFRAAVDCDPGNGVWHFELADRLGKVKWGDKTKTIWGSEAIKRFRVAVELDPSKADWHIKLTEALNDAKLYHEAAAHLKKAVELDPGNATWQVKLGDAIFIPLRFYRASAAHYDQAINLYRAAVELEPYNANWHQKYGDALFMAERYDEAITELKKALDLSPDYGDWHADLADALVKAERYDEAIESSKAAVKLDGEYDECGDESYTRWRQREVGKAIVGYAFKLGKARRYDEAIEYLEKGQELGGWDAADNYEHHRSKFLLLTGQYDEAISYLQDAQDHWIFDDNHPLDDALELWQKGYGNRSPDRALGCYAAIEVLRGLFKNPAGREEPHSFTAYSRQYLGYFLLQNGWYDGMRKMWPIAIRLLKSKNARRYFTLVDGTRRKFWSQLWYCISLSYDRFFLRILWPVEAIQHLTIAAQVDPEHPGMRYLLGLVFERIGRRDEAIKSYKMALDLYPNFREANSSLALRVRSLEQDGEVKRFSLRFWGWILHPWIVSVRKTTS